MLVQVLWKNIQVPVLPVDQQSDYSQFLCDLASISVELLLCCTRDLWSCETNFELIRYLASAFFHSLTIKCSCSCCLCVFFVLGIPWWHTVIHFLKLKLWFLLHTITIYLIPNAFIFLGTVITSIMQSHWLSWWKVSPHWLLLGISGSSWCERTWTGLPEIECDADNQCRSDWTILPQTPANGDSSKC